MTNGPPNDKSAEDIATDLERIRDLFAVSGGDSAARERAESELFREFHRLWHAVPAQADHHLEEMAEEFSGTEIPEEPVDPASYEKELLRKVVARSVHTDSPKFIGHMTSALPGFMPLLSRLLIALNQNQVKTETSRAMTPFERQALGMLHRLVYGRSEAFYAAEVQNIESALGILTSGGTTANVTALWCARNVALGAREATVSRPAFAGIEVEGLGAALEHHGYSGAAIVGSELMHYSFKKVAGLLGIGSKNLLTVRAGRDNRIDLDRLRGRLDDCRERNLRVLALVGIAGTTETGSVDPLEAMADIAAEAGIHFHVDAAWGGPTLFSKRHRSKLAGIERADSVTIDGHKQLYLPLGIGLLLFKDPQTARSIEQQARYTIRAGSGDLGRRSLEGSRPAMVVFLHAALHLLGHRGYEILVDEGIRKTDFLASSIRRRPEFELLAEPELNILVYRYVPLPMRARVASRNVTVDDNRRMNELNEALQRTEGRAGTSFVSRTALETTCYGPEIPIVALRVVLANPLTDEKDIEAVLDEQVATARALEADAALCAIGSKS